ncbi:MAG: RNA polymerase sigma factor [Planctomycetes bacterium]|nr:RNA polymerase sigma factor [Planctomycetota bacterium]
MSRSVRGDLAAFEELIARYQQAVFNIAYYKSRNCFDAEDLTQDVFLAAYQGLSTLKSPENFGGWLFGIAYNRCHKWYHRERNKIVKIQELQQRVAQEQRLARRAALRGASGDEGPPLSDMMLRLPPEIRTVLKLKYLDGLSYQQIEERLGIASHRIDYLIRKGKKLIRQRWGEAGEEESS